MEPTAYVTFLPEHPGGISLMPPAVTAYATLDRSAPPTATIAVRYERPEAMAEFKRLIDPASHPGVLPASATFGR